MKLTKDIKVFPAEKAQLKKFIKGLDHGNEVSDTDLTAFTDGCYRMVLDKDDEFCVAGEVCDTVAFLVSGHLYAHYINKDDKNDIAADEKKEIVTWLFFAPLSRMVSDFESYLTKGIATRTIKASRKTVLICISIEKLDEMYSKLPHTVRI